MSHSYLAFDQYRYENEEGIDHTAACEGWVREAMRRLDRSDRVVPQSLLAMVQQMRKDATRRFDGTATQMFARVGAYQLNASLLALSKLRLRLTERVPADAAHNVAIDTALTHLGNELREREVAFVRLALNPQGADNRPLPNLPRGALGHALLVQRLPGNEYVIFDPNNGAFMYDSLQRTQQALHAYMGVAFSDLAGSLSVVPDSIQYFSVLSRSHAALPLPQATPLHGPPGSSLPRTDSNARRLLAATAQEFNELSGEALSAAAGDVSPLAQASQGIAYVALRDVAQGRVATLMDATEDIWQRLSDPTRRLRSINEISALQDQNRYGLLTDVPHRTRRPGGLHINVAPRLIDDLRLRFGESSDPEDSRIPYRNNFAELRLTFRNPPVAADGAGHVARGTAGGYSIIIQRQGLADDFRRDCYELHEPVSGVFRYADFSAMSDALTSAINDGYPEMGGGAYRYCLFRALRRSSGAGRARGTRRTGAA